MYCGNFHIGRYLFCLDFKKRSNLRKRKFNSSILFFPSCFKHKSHRTFSNASSSSSLAAQVNGFENSESLLGLKLAWENARICMSSGMSTNPHDVSSILKILPRAIRS